MTNEKKVLLIDHSETVLAVISRLIQKNIPGTKVHLAHRAEEALEQLRQNSFHLITMSRNLPGTDCHQLVETIRNGLNVRRTPLIVVSGEDLGLLEENLVCEYVNGYFDKKLGQHKLVAYIKSFLSEDTPETTITGNILYVEDSPTVSQVMKNMLTRHGHQYLLARDAEHALQHLQQAFTDDNIQPFDLVLTDIQLDVRPGTDRYPAGRAHVRPRPDPRNPPWHRPGL